MNKEVWMDIKGYEGLYQVSNHGRVKSLERKVKNGRGIRIVNEKILKSKINNDGYHRITIIKNNKYKAYLIHRLVASHFIINFNNKKDVYHIDGDKLNNYYENLGLCNRKDTIKRAWENGRCENVRKSISKIGKKYGSINSKKYRSKKVTCIETGITYNSATEVGIQLNINQGNISKCCNGKLKSAGGFSWKFA